MSIASTASISSITRTLMLLALLALLAFSAPSRATQTTSTQPLSAVAPILKVDYETGWLNSGIEGLKAEPPQAADSIIIGFGTARSGNKSIVSKVANTPDYISAGAHRAESDTMKLPRTRYNEGDARRYQFSILLQPGWEIDSREFEMGNLQTGFRGLEGKKSAHHFPRRHHRAAAGELSRLF